MTPTPSLRLEEFLPYRLSVLTNKVSRAFANLYGERFGLSVPEWRVMAVLGQDPGLSAEQVCARTEMDKVTVSRAVARLREKGLLAQKFATEDRRRSMLELTDAGCEVYSRIIPLGRRYENELTDVLTVAEQRVLNRLLEKLDSRAAALSRGPFPRPSPASGRGRGKVL
jgi:DNA-binding MarR family transcriptional regulator